MANDKQQVAVVIGASAGMGLETARSLAQRGMKVWMVGRSADKLETARASVGGNAEARALDVREPGAVQGLFEEVGRFDHLVLSAGAAQCLGAFGELGTDAVAEGFNAKFWPHFQAAQRALGYLSDRASITFLTAVSAQTATPGTAGLAAVNGALEAMVRPMAKELGPQVRVNAVSPGIVETDWWSFLPDDARAATFEQVADSVPVGRVGQATDIAHATVMVVENRFMTGTIVPCDGGARLG